MPSQLRIDDLTVSYDGTDVLKGIDLTIPRGQVTAIIGPSGCGKTTLLRSLNRLSEVTQSCCVSGAIYLDGDEIHGLDPILLRRRVGMVFQKPNPFPMSLRENVLYGIKATKLQVDHELTLEQSLRQAALWDEVKDRLHQSALHLSVGQQQRLCIARTLAISPAVVLMDEPAASLDPNSAAKVEETIAALRGDYTVVIVTHNLQQARRVADHTAFLYLGELIEAGPTEELFERAKEDATRAYVNGRFG